MCKMHESLFMHVNDVFSRISNYFKESKHATATSISQYTLFSSALEALLSMHVRTFRGLEFIVRKLSIRCASLGNLAFARGTFAMHNINMLEAMKSKNQFPYPFLCTRGEKSRGGGLPLTKRISNKIPLLFTRATGGSGRLKGAGATLLLKGTQRERETNIFNGGAHQS